jgi:hypothetical protein
MNVWMKRGLRTALLTGGLLAAGSGIASADDRIDVAVPVTVTDNALAVLGTSPGTTAPEITLPAVDALARVDLGPATVAVPVTVGGNSADVAGVDVAQPAAAPPPAGGNGPAAGGNGLGTGGSAVDADVPVTVTGNAVAVLGEAAARGSSGDPSGAGGSASVADIDVPVTVSCTDVAVLGDATTTCTGPTTSGTTTNGTGAPVADIDVPVTVSCTDVAVLGDATASCEAGPTGWAPGDEGPGAPGTPPVAGGWTDATGPADRIHRGPGSNGTAAVLPARSELGFVGTVVGPVTTTGGSTGSTTGSTSTSAGGVATSGRPAGALAWTGTDLTLPAVGGLLALLLGLALSIWYCRRDVETT